MQQHYLLRVQPDLRKCNFRYTTWIYSWSRLPFGIPWQFKGTSKQYRFNCRVNLMYTRRNTVSTNASDIWLSPFFMGQDLHRQMVTLILSKTWKGSNVKKVVLIFFLKNDTTAKCPPLVTPGPGALLNSLAIMPTAPLALEYYRGNTLEGRASFTEIAKIKAKTRNFQVKYWPTPARLYLTFEKITAKAVAIIR